MSNTTENTQNTEAQGMPQMPNGQQGGPQGGMPPMGGQQQGENGQSSEQAQA